VVLIHNVAAVHTLAQASGDAHFNRAAWLADYSALKTALEQSYSHLAWFGSPQSGVDLPALDRTTREALEHARTDAEASAAITAFIASFHDGHLAPTAPPRPATGAASEPPAPTSFSEARTACAALGYLPITRVAFSMPFESLMGFELVADGLTDPFRAGVIEQDGRRIGIVRIPRFRPAEFPSVCERAFSSLRGRGIEPTRAAILVVIDLEWLRTLAARLTQLQTRNITALLIDVGGNGGGNDLGDWAVRLFTRAPVHSAPLLLSAGRVAIPYFDEQLTDLERALKANGNLPEATRSALQRAISEFNQRKQEASRAPCDMSWVWSEQRKWGSSPCTRLIASGFASGALDYAAPGSLDVRAARALYWPAVADSLRGAWNGSTYVLTDANTGSAAEMFTALIRDRGFAKTIGTRTFGLGCGFVDLDQPFVLPNSGRAFRIPNCVRLRTDGTDEVAGIVPDLPLKPIPGESARILAARALRTLASDLPQRNPR
jgi:Peptidase family S41